MASFVGLRPTTEPHSPHKCFPPDHSSVLGPRLNASDKLMAFQARKERVFSDCCALMGLYFPGYSLPIVWATIVIHDSWGWILFAFRAPFPALFLFSLRGYGDLGSESHYLGREFRDWSSNELDSYSRLEKILEDRSCMAEGEFGIRAPKFHRFSNLKFSSSEGNILIMDGPLGLRPKITLKTLYKEIDCTL